MVIPVDSCWFLFTFSPLNLTSFYCEQYLELLHSVSHICSFQFKANKIQYSTGSSGFETPRFLHLFCLNETKVACNIIMLFFLIYVWYNSTMYCFYLSVPGVRAFFTLFRLCCLNTGSFYVCWQDPNLVFFGFLLEILLLLYFVQKKVSINLFL